MKFPAWDKLASQTNGNCLYLPLSEPILFLLFILSIPFYQFFLGLWQDKPGDEMQGAMQN